MLSYYKDQSNNCHAECVRELLSRLRVSANEYECLDIELRETQKDFKQSIQSSDIRKLDCASEERPREFQENEKNIDTISECLKKRVGDMQKKRQNIIEDAEKYFNELEIEKKKLYEFQEKAINRLKTFIINSDEQMAIRDCEKTINEMNKKFAKELFYIKKCENALRPFFLVLNEYKNHGDDGKHIKEYDWIPSGKSMESVQKITNEIKDFMGIALRKTFANLCIHQPSSDSESFSFLAQYLLTMQRNDEMVEEKLQRFTSL